MNNPANSKLNPAQSYPVRLPDQNLFSPVEIKPVHGIFNLFSGWLFKIHKVCMEDGIHYISDIGFNQRLYFNKTKVRSGNKYFWRVNTSKPFEKIASIPMAFRLPVSVETHNFYQSGLNKFEFKYSIIMVVPDSYVVARLMSLELERPFKSIELAVQGAAREIVAERDYKLLFTASSEITKAIKDAVTKDQTVVETGVQIKDISCEFLIGDQDLFSLVKKIYARCEEAKSLSSISELEWRRYLESAVPGIALQEETRRRESIINALVALRLPISDNELRSEAIDLSKKIFG